MKVRFRGVRIKIRKMTSEEVIDKRTLKRRVDESGDLNEQGILSPAIISRGYRVGDYPNWEYYHIESSWYPDLEGEYYV